MKYSVLVLLSVCLCLNTIAKEQTSFPKLSPLTKLYLQKSGKLSASEDHVPGYVYKRGSNGVLYITALVKVHDGAAQEEMQQLGVQIGTQAGNIWTTQVPVDKVPAFTRLEHVAYIQLDEPAAMMLD